MGQEERTAPKRGEPDAVAAVNRAATPPLEAANPVGDRYRELVESLEAIVWEADATTRRFTFVSHGAELVLGHPVDQWLRTPDFWASHIHPADREPTLQYTRTATAEGRDHTLEYRAVAADGRVVWLRNLVHVVRNAQGQAQHLRGLMLDVSDRKRAGEALRLSEEKFRDLVENLSDVIFAVDRDGVITYVSPVAEALGGYRPSELIGRPFWEFIDPDDRPKLMRGFERALSGAQTPAEYRVRVRSGELRWVRSHGRPIWQEGRATGLRGVLTDITDSKQTEEQVRRLNAELEQRVATRTAELEAINNELEAFCHSVSHDLRAPLRAISGFGHALLEDYASRLDDEGKGMLNRVVAASQRMNQLIDALLELSRVTQTEMHREVVDLTSLACTITAELRETQPERAVDVDIEDGLVAQGDARLLHVVLENLLGNAWKFTNKRPRAHIEFRAVRDGDLCIFFVRDDGAGFDMKRVHKLFGAFQRLHGPDEFEGTGIGLATVKRIVHRHGGRVWAEGAVGEGATFYFTLP